MEALKQQELDSGAGVKPLHLKPEFAFLEKQCKPVADAYHKLTVLLTRYCHC